MQDRALGSGTEKNQDRKINPVMADGECGSYDENYCNAKTRVSSHCTLLHHPEPLLVRITHPCPEISQEGAATMEIDTLSTFFSLFFSGVLSLTKYLSLALALIHNKLNLN
jgi:hypothetical protein